MSKSNYTPRLKEQYLNKIAAELKQELKVSNVHEIPRMEKIVLNMGVGQGTQDRKKVAKAVEELTLIAGQKALPTIAKKSVAQFKLRDGMAIGTKVTLRGNRMYEFLDRLINVALPRTKDFRGLSPKSFDRNGNYAMGIKEHIIFPEIDYDQIDVIKGLDVVMVTSTNKDDHARSLLKSFGLPIKD